MQDPKTWFDGRPRMMFVHAHPDDETITTGGTLAGLAAAGQEPLLVTLTRGERGEVVPGPLEALAGTHGLAVVRQNELKTALDMLGLERHVFLGVPPARAEGLQPYLYEDSGMAWGADGRATAAAEASPDALTRAPAVEVLNDLLAAAYQAGAQGIVGYDDGGGYGHPDHVLAHRLSRAVAHALGIPFWQILDTGSLDAAAGTGVEGAEGPSVDPGQQEGAGDEEHSPGVEDHEIAPWYDRKVAALRAHGTQLQVVGNDIVHVGGQREPIRRVESFRRIDG